MPSNGAADCHPPPRSTIACFKLKRRETVPFQIETALAVKKRTRADNSFLDNAIRAGRGYGMEDADITWRFAPNNQWMKPA